MVITPSEAFNQTVQRYRAGREPVTAQSPVIGATTVLGQEVEPRTDAEVRQLIIRESLLSYSGNCPCPYNTDSAGGNCGRRSAYSHPGGASPMCYDRDISDDQVTIYRDLNDIPIP